MIRSCLGLLTVLITTTVVQAKIDIEGVQAVYGIFGPERKSLETYPGDEMIFRFLVTGAKVDDNGQTDAVMSLKLTNNNNDVLLAQDFPIKGLLALGGNTFPAHARILLSEKTPPGDYNMTVTMADKLSNEKTSFQRKIICKPTEFALVAPEFFRDAEGKVAAQPGGLLSQVVYFRMRGIGIDRTKDKIDTTMTLEVLDAKGKEMMPKPIKVEIKNDDPDVVRQSAFVTYRGQVTLNRTGDFTLRITVTDNIAKKTIKFETPLKVTAP